MELHEALQQLDALQKKMYAFNAARSSLLLDAVTVAPSDTAEGRGIALGILAGERQKLTTSPEVGELLDYLTSRKDQLDTSVRRQVEELQIRYHHMKAVPADEYMEYARLQNQSGSVWRKAKETNDFELFRPILEKMVAFNRKFAGYYDSSKTPYDALLNEYERGVDVAYLDQFFSTIREKLVPLIRSIGEKEQLDDSFLHQEYPLDARKKFSDYLMDVIGVDRTHCTIGETEHPFTQHFNNKDVRITTNYNRDFASSIFSVIHESGHAMYELGICDEIQYTCLSGGVSMGVHESQSRFYENMIGRSLSFIQAIFPKLQEFFPQQLGHVTAEQFYRAINRSTPSLIRIEADELTYCLHVMVRYEIEKELFNGALEVKDIPATWNRLYKEYLGVDVPDDRCGCLQDSHWSNGQFGYFPSYALGSAYAAQMAKNMEAEFDLWEQVSRGDLSRVNQWLGQKVHQYGKLLQPAEVIANACGTFDSSIYTDYLTEKYASLYDLNS